MNLVATHYNCTSPMDYISHHALHPHIPIHHYTNSHSCHLSLINPVVLPHLPSFTHPHISSPLPYTRCEVLFLPRLTFLSIIHPAISVFDPGLPDLGTLNLCLWPRPLPGIVYVSALPLIFLFCPLTIAWLILSNKYCCKWIHSPLTSLYRRPRQKWIQQWRCFSAKGHVPLRTEGVFSNWHTWLI